MVSKVPPSSNSICFHTSPFPRRLSQWEQFCPLSSETGSQHSLGCDRSCFPSPNLSSESYSPQYIHRWVGRRKGKQKERAPCGNNSHCSLAQSVFGNNPPERMLADVIHSVDLRSKVSIKESVARCGCGTTHLPVQ